MKYAVIDTETSGLFDFSKPADAEGQPRMASFAVITVDPALEVLEEHSFLVAPDDWEMSAGAAEKNGLDTNYLKEYGWPVAHILSHYVALIDRGFVIAAFNAQFDTKVLRGELRRAGIPDRFEVTQNICVMRALTDICKVPKKSGFGWKFPKLEEACAHFGIKQDAAHTAMGDTHSALSLLRELHKLGKIPTPEVHFAKMRPGGEAAS